MITNSNIGSMGRLGNQLFQIASTIGIAKLNKQQYAFPKWHYEKYFIEDLPVQTIKGALIKEKGFNYTEIKLPCHCDYDLKGYFQSAKYWKHCDQEIKQQFEFKDKTDNRLPNNGRPNIAIHIRRGDYVESGFHYNLSLRYYINAIQSIKNWDKCNLIFFSDDIEFCKWHFSCLSNAFFVIGGSDIQDLQTMTLCDHFIIANSSFSWWGAYLGADIDSIVIRPYQHFIGSSHNIKDLYPDHWSVISDSDKVNITDTTFIIPVSYDHNDRMVNLNLSVQHIQQNFDTNVRVIEQNDFKFSYVEGFAKYTNARFEKFHRTRIINNSAKQCETPYIVNWDADIILNPVQIWYSVNKLRAGSDIVYPYDGNFKHIKILDKPNISKNHYWLIKAKLTGATMSYGGAIFMNRESFFSVGGENEKFISWGPEDAERYVRFIKLGLKVVRLNGSIFHLDHYRGIDSGRRNQHLEANRKEWHMIEVMDPGELKKYVKTWPWI